MDGKGIVMHQKDLRDLTRKAAERAKSKPKSYRLGKGEKRNRKRMATVATVYTINHYNRTAEEIMGINKRDDENPQPRAKHKRVWASVERDPLEVAKEAFKEALRRDPNNEREWVVLVDGDRYQIERIYSLIDKYQIDAVVILDYIHVLEYLWKAAYCFNKENSVEAEKWVAKRGLNILKGKAIDVAAGMRRSATLRNLTKEQRKSVDKCANYLLIYSNLLFYDHYIESGFPIATGVIEGACRHLIKDRMDITGARWRLKSAEAVLKLRSLHSSGDLDEYMVFHNNQELKRNHFSQTLDIQHQKAA